MPKSLRIACLPLLTAAMVTIGHASASAQIPGVVALDASVGTGEKVTWEHAHLLVRPSAQYGIQLWLWFSRASATDPLQGQTYGFDLRPDEVEEWIADAEFVLDAVSAKTDVKSGPKTIHLSSPSGNTLQLIGFTSDTVVNYRLLLATPTGDRAAVAATRDEVKALLTELRSVAGRSTWTISPETNIAGGCGLRVGDAGGCTAPRLPKHLPLVLTSYTPGAQYGEAWAEFIVDERGTPIAESIEVLWASSDAWAAAARLNIPHEKFTPAMDSHGSPRKAIAVAHWFNPRRPGWGTPYGSGPTR